MILRSIVLVAITLSTGLVHAQTAPLTPRHLLDSLRLHADRQCNKVMKLSKSAANDAEAAALQPVMGMACECMPAEIDQAVAKLTAADERRELTNAAAIKIASDLQATCTARHLRVLVKQQCESGLPTDATADEKKAHCTCVADAADQTPDQRWVEASVQQHEHFMAKVRAQMAGKAEPPAPTTVMSSIPAECKARSKAPNGPDVPPWMGTWNGPEGTYLKLVDNQAGKASVIIRNLDGERTFEGTIAADHIAFVRDGQAETIKASNGQGTGMKWLADKTNCLTVKAGEGYCRD